MNPFTDVSCIILSAGSSGRMGGHKALLKFDETRTFIEKIINEYLKAGITKVIVVVSSDLNNKIKDSGISFPDTIHIVINHKPDLGRFYSLQTGIQHLDEGNYCFFQNIDNPFTSVEILQDLIAQKEQADVIIPAFKNKAGHPVLLNPWVLMRLKQEKVSELRIDQYLRKFIIKRIETSKERILVNINSIEEYKTAGFK